MLVIVVLDCEFLPPELHQVLNTERNTGRNTERNTIQYNTATQRTGHLELKTERPDLFPACLDLDLDAHVRAGQSPQQRVDGPTHGLDDLGVGTVHKRADDLVGQGRRHHPRESLGGVARPSRSYNDEKHGGDTC